MTRRGVAGAVAVVMAAGLIAGCGTSTSTADATVLTCAVGPGGGQPTAQGTVVNTSSETSTFVVRVSFYDSRGDRVSEGVTNVGDVEPATTGNWTITGVTSTNEAPTCKVTSLRRTSVGQA